MSFEFNRRIGLAGTAVIVASTVITPIVSVIAYFSGLLQNTLASALLLSLLSCSGYILLLVSMNRFAHYYQNPAIFSNALYGFLTAVAGSLLFTLVTFGAFSSLRSFLESITRNSGALPSVPAIAALFAFLAVFWLGIVVLAVVQGFFLRPAFYALAKKSGEQNFRQAGFFMFIGGILTIIAIGALIFFLGWITALTGFNSLRSRVSEPPRPSNPPIDQVKYCPKCGKINFESDVFCTRCGARLWRGGPRNRSLRSVL